MNSEPANTLGNDSGCQFNAYAKKVKLVQLWEMLVSGKTRELLPEVAVQLIGEKGVVLVWEKFQLLTFQYKQFEIWGQNLSRRGSQR